MKKRNLLIGMMVVAAVVLSGCWKKTASPQPTPKPKLVLPSNIIPVSERPFVTISPTGAREVVLTIGSLKKSAESVDFELQYSAGEKEEAAIGSLDLAKGKDQWSKTILLGSKSGGGKITYHENVTGGTLALTFYNENYKISNDWAYIDNRKPTALFTSRDGKFSVDTGKLLKSMPYVIVYQNPGLPSAITGTVLAGPYSVSGTSSLPTGMVTISMRLSDAKKATIYGWTGKEWKTFPTTVDGKSATAKADLVQSYIAVEK